MLLDDRPKSLVKAPHGSSMQPARPGLAEPEIASDMVEPFTLQIVSTDELGLLVRQTANLLADRTQQLGLGR